MSEKLVLIGAGSAVFTKGLVADALARGSELTIGLVDPRPEALEVARGLTTRMVHRQSVHTQPVQGQEASISVEASTDRRDVLPGATTVICTVGVGGREAWLQDVVIPRKYGIYQPVGDTIMPGGLSRALRMVPAMVEIAEDVARLCPSALFFNYGNPMSAVCRGIRKETTAQVIGLCHGVHHAVGFLSRILDVEERDVRYTALGINHLTWFTELRAHGRDLMPTLHEYGRRMLVELFDSDGIPRKAATEDRHNPASWQLLSTFGAFPAVLDRHTCEFFPYLYSSDGTYFGKTLGTDCYSLENTIANGDRSYEEMKSVAAGASEVPEEFYHRSSGEHEQVLDIVESIRSDSQSIYSANLPNTGQIPNLPEDAVVEGPAVADGSGLRAIQQPPLPSGVAGTLQRPLAAIETVVDAALRGDRRLFVQALLIDGSVTSHTSAERLADELLAAHREHLPRFR